MEELKHTTFIAAMRTFFGMMPGQTLQQFAAEVRELTAKDREDFIGMLRTVGFDATKTS